MDARMPLFNTFDGDLCKHSGAAAIGRMVIAHPSYVEPRLPGVP
jgi:hypothetical protein